MVSGELPVRPLLTATSRLSSPVPRQGCFIQKKPGWASEFIGTPPVSGPVFAASKPTKALHCGFRSTISMRRKPRCENRLRSPSAERNSPARSGGGWGNRVPSAVTEERCRAEMKVAKRADGGRSNLPRNGGGQAAGGRQEGAHRHFRRSRRAPNPAMKGRRSHEGMAARSSSPEKNQATGRP